MKGIAESNPYSVSRRIVDSFKIGESYPISLIEEVIGYKPGGADRKGVLGGKATDFICLKITLEKNYMNINYNDHIENSTLFWSGQNNRRFAENCVVDGAHDVFIFARALYGNNFLYYGRAVPIRMMLSNVEGQPSHVVFDLCEYAESQWYRDSCMFMPQYDKLRYRRDSLKLWNYRCTVNNVVDESLLVSRHIKPIEESRQNEIPDVHNSIVLTPGLDNVFSRGIVSFERNGKILLPDSLELRTDLKKMDIDANMCLKEIPEGTKDYLDYHNSYIFGFKNYNYSWKFK